MSTKETKTMSQEKHVPDALNLKAGIFTTVEWDSTNCSLRTNRCRQCIWDTFVTFPSAYTVFQTVVSDIFPLKVSFTEHTKTTDDTIRLLFLCWLPNIRKSVEITKRKELNFFFLKKNSNHFHQRISVHSKFLGTKTDYGELP